MSRSDSIYFNASGCADPTAARAIRNIVNYPPPKGSGLVTAQS